MALDKCALSELLAALRPGDGIDLIRDAVRLVFQELIDTEATAVIGAQPYERTSARTNERNGHCDPDTIFASPPSARRTPHTMSICHNSIDRDRSHRR